jgi:hypothetical protein
VAVQQVDDPVLVDLLCLYQGQLVLDEVKIPGRRKFEKVTYVTTGVQYDYKRGGDYYEATCALVYWTATVFGISRSHNISRRGTTAF